MHSNGETWCARIRGEIRTLVRRPEIIHIMFWCGVEACRIRTTLLHSWNRRRTTDATYTMPRNEKKTHVRGWIRKNTRIGPVLNTKVCHHEDQYTIEVLVKSLFQDRTASWARIVNGVDKYVTESLLTKEEEDIAPVKPIAKARPRQKPRVALTSVSIPVFERNWVDIETQRSHGQQCFEVSKPLSDCYDMIKQSFAEVTEQSSTMTSSKSAGRRSSMVLRDGHVS